ncbi:phytolongin Phyl2.2 [Euphorbia lathyris]|uniref:phytolongin Phyl2.2 n=1 Tax=Euphorbia lathyris TaxID=212925 RepID=UPI003313CE50
MISNPDLIFYACIAKGSIIVAEFSNSKQPGIEEIAQRCIEKTPVHHSVFSHTIRKKTYTFLFHDPFVYFVIFDEDLAKSESFLFLDRVKMAFDELIAANPVEDFDYLCLQSTFHPVLSEILAFDSDLVNSFTDVGKVTRNPSMDLRSTGNVSSPLLSKPGKNMMKKKKRPLVCGRSGSDGGGGGEANGDNQNFKEFSGSMMDNKVNHVGENGDIMMTNKEFSVSMHKNNGNNGFYFGDSKQKAKQIWRKHVWIVLILDLVICAVLFGIWLWVCRGFKCIDG